MSIVAWDGVTLAADRQATCAGLRFTTRKMRQLSCGTVLAWTGDMDSGEAIALWYEQGAVAEKWPECQKDKDRWSRLIVAKGGILSVYEREPLAMPVQDRVMAWGSGRDYALGAMAKGATAVEAVEIACRFDTGCGMGIDSIHVSMRLAYPERNYGDGVNLFDVLDFF